jgi:hypothetical protein
MTGEDSGETSSTIGGGTFSGPVLQARDVVNPTFVTNQAAAAPVALAQLPPLAAGFTGREAELAQVAGLLDPADGTAAVVVSAVAGLAGVGKTALAVHAAHAARLSGWCSPARRWTRCCGRWGCRLSTSRWVPNSGRDCTAQRWRRSKTRC